MLERGEHVSFANCGLPYYAGGSIEQRDALLLQTPESLWSRFRLDVRTRPEVLGVDRATREVTVRRPGGTGGTVGTVGTEGYDVLVLGPGARPIVPEIPGVERALVLRDVSDVDRVVAGLRSGARPAVIVGGGFIGVPLPNRGYGESRWGPPSTGCGPNCPRQSRSAARPRRTTTWRRRWPP